MWVSLLNEHIAPEPNIWNRNPDGEQHEDDRIYDGENEGDQAQLDEGETAAHLRWFQGWFWRDVLI